MCTGSFFPSFPFCLACLHLHGLRSQRDLAYSAAVLATASGALCDVATPTAEFGLLYASARARVPYPTTGDPARSDAAAGRTAVSLYFTPSASQGPGRITGDAMQATATQLFTAPVGAASSTGLPSASSPSSSSSASEEVVAGLSSGVVAGGGAGLSSSTTSGAAVETGIGPGNGTVVSRGERVNAWAGGLVLVVGGVVGAGRWLL